MDSGLLKADEMLRDTLLDMIAAAELHETQKMGLASDVGHLFERLEDMQNVETINLYEQRDALRVELDALREQHDHITNAARAVLDMWRDAAFWGFVFIRARHVENGADLLLDVDRGQVSEKMNFLFINAYPEQFEAVPGGEGER